MLTPGQIEYINWHGLYTLHDYWFISITSGEPFLESGILAYYDGRLMTICGCPFRGQLIIPDEIFCRVITNWVVDRNVQGIAFMGPQSLDLNCLQKYGFRQTGEEERDELSVELFIDCTDGPGTIFERKVYRRSSRLGFEATIKQGEILSAEHFSLIELFYSLRYQTHYLADLSFALPTFFRSPRTYIIEARKQGRLCGFVALHIPFKDVAVALFLTHDYKTPGVSDFLYSKMIYHARQLGVTRINIGASPTIGHYNFKRKWSADSDLPSYGYIEWSRGLLARRCYKSWGPRIIRL